jgi:protein-disulfide isomerase
MKMHVAALAALVVVGCENKPSQLDGIKNVEARDRAPGGSAEVLQALRNIDRRLTALEDAHKIGAPGADGKDPSLAERVGRLEATLVKREEALAMLDEVYQQQKHQQEAEEAQQADPNAIFAVDITGPIKAGQVEGPNSATVTIIKAFDFACPYCEKLNDPLHELVKEYDGKVRVVYMNLLVHPPAQAAHQYSCAAAKQQKYLAWKDAWWSKGFQPYAQSGGRDQSSLSEDNILKFSGELGLDTAKLKADANSNECKQRIADDAKELEKFHVNATPGLFINGTFISGAIPKDEFKTIIDEKLKIAQTSGVTGAAYYDKEVMGKGLKQFKSKADSKHGG